MRGNVSCCERQSRLGALESGEVPVLHPHPASVQPGASEWVEGSKRFCATCYKTDFVSVPEFLDNIVFGKTILFHRFRLGLANPLRKWVAGFGCLQRGAQKENQQFWGFPSGHSSGSGAESGFVVFLEASRPLLHDCQYESSQTSITDSHSHEF